MITCVMTCNRLVFSQDVRATEIDKVVMYECFRPGDVVVAEVGAAGICSLFSFVSYFLQACAIENAECADRP